MRGPVILGMGLLAATLVVGCSGGSPEEATVKESISLMNDMASVLETIKDEKTAKEAEAKLKTFESRGKALEKKMKELPKEKLEQAGKKYEAEGKAAGERFGKAMMNSIKFVGPGFGPNMLK